MSQQLHRHSTRNAKLPFSLLSLDDGYVVGIDAEMLVGRESDCDLILESRHVSRYQATLKVTPMGLVIEDLHSTNGTYVNGKRISAPRLLQVGDEVSFYATRFVVQSDSLPIAEQDATAFAPPLRNSAHASTLPPHLRGRAQPVSGDSSRSPDDDSTRLYGTSRHSARSPRGNW